MRHRFIDSSSFLRSSRVDMLPGKVISMFIEIRNPQMDSKVAIGALSALAQEYRLAVFRLLVEAGGAGMPAGGIAERLGIPNSSLSFHLAQLSRAGLIAQERRRRSIIYRADYETMNALVGYLMENCCGGSGCSTETACVSEAAPAQSERKIACSACTSMSE